MPSIQEFLGSSGGELAAVLCAGTDAISNQQDIIFKAYRRTVLPADGYVYLLADASIETMTVRGSLHYDTRFEMREDEQIGINRVILTAEQPVQAFSAANSTQLIWIGKIDGIRFALSSRGAYYRQAGLHHYLGDAIYPAMFDLVVDDPSAFKMNRLIATNSIPIWLLLKPEFPLFPAFLPVANQAPPYATVRIAQTQPIQAVPWIDADGKHWQLVSDKCRFTFYGLGNDDVLRFIDQVMAFCLDGNLGLMNQPVVVDDARPQRELGAIATKKVCEFEVSYYQTHAQQVAQQLILEALATVTPTDTPS